MILQILGVLKLLVASRALLLGRGVPSGQVFPQNGWTVKHFLALWNRTNQLALDVRFESMSFQTSRVHKSFRTILAQKFLFLVISFVVIFYLSESEHLPAHFASCLRFGVGFIRLRLPVVTSGMLVEIGRGRKAFLANWHGTNEGFRDVDLFFLVIDVVMIRE